MRKTALYTRVSTRDQTIDNQLQELEPIIKARGWLVVDRFADVAISGSKGRDQRPGLDALIQGAKAGRYDMVAVWSVDRLGRSLKHLINTLSAIQESGSDLFLLQQNIDTTTPFGRAVFGMLGVFAEFERAMIVERVKAGLVRAASEGKTLGRKPFDVSLRETVFWLLQAGVSKRQIARHLHISRSTVLNIEREFNAEKLTRSTWAMALVVPIMAKNLPPHLRLECPAHLQIPNLSTEPSGTDLTIS